MQISFLEWLKQWWFLISLAGGMVLWLFVQWHAMDKRLDVIELRMYSVEQKVQTIVGVMTQGLRVVPPAPAETE